MPTATSPRAISTPTGVATWRRRPNSACSGLMRSEAMSWAWMPDGFWGLKKLGLASFCRPAKRKVTPRKARSGRMAQPAMDGAPGGGDRNARRAREGSGRGGRGVSGDRCTPRLCAADADVLLKEG